jgi:hypothetical protein
LKAGKGSFTAKDTHPHRFFDRENQALWLVSLLGQSADAITTQRFIQITGLFGLHKIHQHWAERIVPAVIGGVSGWEAYSNLKHQ